MDSICHFRYVQSLEYGGLGTLDCTCHFRYVQSMEYGGLGIVPVPVGTCRVCNTVTYGLDLSL